MDKFWLWIIVWGKDVFIAHDPVRRIAILVMIFVWIVMWSKHADDIIRL